MSCAASPRVLWAPQCSARDLTEPHHFPHAHTAKMRKSVVMNGTQQQQQQQQQQLQQHQQQPTNPGPAYDLQRSAAIGGAQQPNSFPSSMNESLEGSQIDSSEITYSNFHQHPQSPKYRSTPNSISSTGKKDATQAIHEMHLALLYLLSNPEEFQKALLATPREGATTLAEWNAEYEDGETTTIGGGFDDDDDDTRGGGRNSVASALTSSTTAPLPFVVFADDAEVVLPQAHTASQLFGIERYQGIELEAAAGIPALSQLFLRWLALMPSGDHLNIIDPPGLTVMRIAGGRYRVTAAHRVVWTWMNEFATLSEDGLDGVDEFEEDEDTAVAFGHDSDEERQKQQPTKNHSQSPALQMGDLVTMTIVDVFETDSNGKLLSYCPTFDNRALHKTTVATETLRKSSSKIMSQLSLVAQSKAAQEVNKGMAHLTRLGFTTARNITESVIQRVDEAIHSASPQRRGDQSRLSSASKAAAVGSPQVVHNSVGFEKAMNQAEAATSDVASHVTKNSQGSSNHSSSSKTNQSTGKSFNDDATLTFSVE